MIGRRALLVGFGAAGLACSRREPPPPTLRAPEPQEPPAVEAGARGGATLIEWDFDADAGGPEHAAVVVPTGSPERWPLVVALHGRGEARKPPAVGAMGWPRDYALMRAYNRLCAPPLVDADLEGFVDTARLKTLNDALAARPFAGLVVACPYVPDLDLDSERAVDAYGRFLLQNLLPRARRDAPVLPAAASTGIDGVSLGGAIALRVGLANPDAFGAVGAVQPAVREEDVPAWTSLAQAALARNPSLKLRLLTSSDDHFRDAIRRLGAAWQAAGVSHELVEVPGPHDYPFNRGPGSIELLFWHDRVLARG